MKLILAALLFASTFTAYSVSNVVNTADNTYTADRNTGSNPPTLADDPKNPPTKAGADVADKITILTSGCVHGTTPGETGVVLTGPNGATITFSGGGLSCKVISIH